MKMSKRQFRIGELAKYLSVERFVIRFWEKEFDVKSHRSSGGQRFYQEKDLEQFQQIKDLLYNKGYTIAGAKKELKKKNPTDIIASQKTTMEPETSHASSSNEVYIQHLLFLQKQLMKLRELL